MSKKKCIFKNGEQNDDEPDFLLSPCFKINSDVKIKEVPTNGEEYLLKVIRERENYSVVTKCNRDYSKFAKNQSRFVQEVPCPTAPSQLKPTIEWQNIQVADFSDIRMYISRMLTKKSSLPCAIKHLQTTNNEYDVWKKFLDEKEPTLSCVLGVQQSILDHGIETLIQILGEIPPGHSIDKKTGQWIYAFLACTRQPLVSDTISVLRELARKCADIRSKIDPEDENAKEAVAPLNIFICLVARYFGQFDLAD